MQAETTAGGCAVVFDSEGYRNDGWSSDKQAILTISGGNVTLSEAKELVKIAELFITMAEE